VVLIGVTPVHRVSARVVKIHPVRTISRKLSKGQDPQRLHARHLGSDRTIGLVVNEVKIQSDPHGDMGSQAEMTWPLADDQMLVIIE
jgi:hypothetical protein